MKIHSLIVAALCGFSFSSLAANTVTCYNNGPHQQICISTNGYAVTCNESASQVVCTGTDGATQIIKK